MTEPATRWTTFRIPAMDCPEELGLIQKGLKPLAGICQLQPDYLNRSLRVEHVEDFDSELITDKLAEIGFPSQDPHDHHSSSHSGATKAPQLQSSVLFGGIVLLLAFVVWLAGDMPHLVALLATISTMLSGLPVAQAAWRAVKLRSIDMYVLMAIAGVGALLTREWFEAATAMFLFGVSLWLESLSVDRARRAVQTLVELTPDHAHKLAFETEGDGYTVADVCLHHVHPGDQLLIRPGERVPVDGVVVDGSSTLNEAPITGESVPQEKQQGDAVFGGALNGEGSLRIRVERSSENSTIARIGRLVEQAQSNRSETERFIHRFARYYTPTVIVLALLVALLPPILGWLSPQMVGLSAEVAWSTFAKAWFHRGLVLLVIACPCALVISTPLTIVFGLHRAARMGLLVKGGQHLETAGRINAIALDKTGTLTVGKPEVVSLIAVDGFSENELLQIAASIERHSEHPLATAIVLAANDRKIDLVDVVDFESVRGLGARAIVQANLCLVGSLRFIREQSGKANYDSEQIERELAHVATGHPGSSTLVFVCRGGHVVGCIGLSDAPRPGASNEIQRWRQLGIDPIMMLTGDRAESADKIAAKLAINPEHVQSEMLPETKIEAIAEQVSAGRVVAMVGDGVNDAPALATASIGVAMGRDASDTAIETGDVVVLSPKLSGITRLIQLGRRTLQILSQNIGFALAIKAIVMILALLGIAKMWMAVGADVGASLLVIVNGMRLLSCQFDEVSD